MVDGINTNTNNQSLSGRLGLDGTTAGDVIDSIAYVSGIDKLFGGDAGLNALNAKPDTLQRFAPINGGTVTVKRGDTLDSIAKANGTTWQQLKALNPQISNANLIRPGQKITLPANATQNYTVRSGDTLSAIATRFGTTPQAIKDANPRDVTNINRIYPGDQLRIPRNGGAQGAGVNTNVPKPPVVKASTVETTANPLAPATTGIITPGKASLKAADIAQQRAAGRGSIGKCYAWVKDALLAGGATSRRLNGIPAKEAGAELRSQGFVNVLGKPGYNIQSPYDAPKGAVLVYGAAPGATDKNAKYGHIEIRTSSGFASDYASIRARTGAASNGLVGTGPKARVLIGVYIKPDAGAKPPQAPIVDRPQPAAKPLPTNMADISQRVGTIISHGEGGYESYNAGTLKGRVKVSKLNPPSGTVTNKTINEIIASGKLHPTDPNRLFATGKYQTIIPTLKAAKEAMGLTGNERYTPEMQERVFREFLIGKAGGGKLAAFINRGEGSVDSAQYAASKEWASIAVPAGLPISGYTDKNGKYHPGPISNGRMSYYESKANHANMGSTNQLRAVLEQIDASRAKPK